jgi:hypothetical protein
MACMKLGSKSEVFHLDGHTWSVTLSCILMFICVCVDECNVFDYKKWGFCQSWKSYNGFILFFVFMLRWVFGLIMIVLEGNIYVRLLCVCGLSCLRNVCLKMITCKDHCHYIVVLM